MQELALSEHEGNKASQKMDSYQHGARTQLSARVALCLAAAGFFSVPLVTAFVMSGKAENSVKAVSAIFLILPAFIVAAAFKDRIIASGIAVIAVCTFLAYVSSTLEYTSGSRYAGEIAELFGGRPLALEGYVEKADALPGNSMFIRIEKIDGKELEKPVSAYTYNRTGHYFCEGLHISFNAGLRLPENSESRDDNFDFVSWLKGKGVYLEVYDVSEFAAEASDGQVSSLRSALTDRVFSGVDSALSLIPDTDVYLRSRAMSRALMFGETSGFEDQDLDNFSRSGVTHILSVSGIHFSVVLGALGSVLRIVIRRKKPRLVILAAFSAVYLYLCAFTASALRAAIMAFIASTGIAGDGKNKTSLSLLATVSVMCIVKPSVIYDMGFHLSVLSCAGIACSTGVCTYLRQKWSFHPVLLFLAETTNMSLASFAFTFAYSISAFAGVSVVSVPASLAVVFPAQICLVLCWIASVAGYAGFYPLSFAAGSVISRLSESIFASAAFFGNLPGAYVNKKVPDISTAVFFIGLALTSIVSAGLIKGAKLYFAALVLALVCVTAVTVISV